MTYAKKTLSEIKLIHGNYGNFIKGQKLPKDKEKKYKTPPYQDLAASNEIDGEHLNEKCWPGYEKKGMKTMFGKRYPNCVKKKKTRKEEYSDWRSEIESIQEKKIGKGKDEFFIDSTGKKKRMSQATRQDVGMAPKDPINVTPTGFRAKVDDAKNFLKQKVKLPKSASKVPGVKGAAKLLSKTPKGALVAAGLLGAVAGARAIGRKFNEIRKKRKDAAIDKQVDKYVADRKGPIKKVNYMPDNMYTVKRDKDGKATGTGDQIRVVPGTRTIKRMPKPGERSSIKSRFSQHTKMKLGNYGSLSPMDEATMTPSQKRKDTMLKKKYEKSDDMMKSFKDQYGKEKGENVFYAFIRKKSMEPKKVEEKLDKKDIPFLKDLAGKLSDGAKKHKRQSEKIKLALNTEDTAIKSELVIQDWNSDDIKFTEIETVDIIKAKPLKESMTDKEFMKTDVEMKNNAAAGVSVSQEKQNDYVKEVNRRLKLKNQKKVVAGEQEFKTKEMKKEHYNWRDELDEDWQKINRKDKTDGLSRKAVKAYRRENPGSKLQTAVTKDPKKLKKGSKDAKRRLSFCRRMKGMKKKLTSAKTRRDPDSRINKALRRWNC